MNPLPDLAGWATFAAVADAGSVAGAARELGVGKATVSKALARLEGALGLPLFHRTSRRLTLTPSGHELVPRARAMVAAARAAEEAARDGADGLVGPIRVTAPLSFGLRHVAGVVAEWLAAHPGTSVDLRLSDARVDLVAEGFDIGVRIGLLPDSSLKARRLCAVPMVTVASPAYRAEHGAPADPHALIAHRCLVYTAGGSPDPWRFAGPAGEVAFGVDGPLRVDNGDAMLPLLLAGGGVAQLPAFIVRDAMGRGQLVDLMPHWPVPPLALHLVMPPGRLRPARVDAMLNFLADRLRRSGEGA